jgi:hypothetical protein
MWEQIIMPISFRDEVLVTGPTCGNAQRFLPLPSKQRVAGSNPAGRGLQLWATGQRPHYDVVFESQNLESLVARLAAAPHRIVENHSVDREEH